jgi:hypothetical protein
VVVEFRRRRGGGGSVHPVLGGGASFCGEEAWATQEEAGKGEARRGPGRRAEPRHAWGGCDGVLVAHRLGLVAVLLMAALLFVLVAERERV